MDDPSTLPYTTDGGQHTYMSSLGLIINEMDRLRDFINRPRVSHCLSRHTRRWDALCAGMNAIEDTARIAARYCEGGHGEAWEGRLLAIYGVLQALYVQQDSCWTIYRVLHAAATDAQMPVSILISDDPSKDCVIGPIRELRNRTIGHPVDYNLEKRKPASFISQVSISPVGMSVRICDQNGAEIKTPVIPDLVDQQHRHIAGIIGRINAAFVRHNAAWAEKFLSPLLSPVFEGWEDRMTQVNDAITSGDVACGQQAVTALQRTVGEFERGMIMRYKSLAAIQGIQSDISACSSALATLARYFNSGATMAFVSSTRRDADAVAKWLHEFEESARQVDQDLAEDSALPQT